jgi:hypothetical protein
MNHTYFYKKLITLKLKNFTKRKLIATVDYNKKIVISFFKKEFYKAGQDCIKNLYRLHIEKRLIYKPPKQ